MTHAEQALIELKEAGKFAFITLESDKDSELVVFRFRDDDASHRFHSALRQCGKVAMELQAKTKKVAK